MRIFLTDEVESKLTTEFFENITLKIADFLKDKTAAEKIISILITDDETIKELNSIYRKKDTATDVLSFEMQEEDILGDIVISLDTAKVMAEEYELSLNNEVAFLYIHGVLHLLGYDHERSEADEKTMFDTQKAIFDIVKA